jgi:hypothetical protein
LSTVHGTFQRADLCARRAVCTASRRKERPFFVDHLGDRSIGRHPEDELELHCSFDAGSYLVNERRLSRHDRPPNRTNDNGFFARERAWRDAQLELSIGAFRRSSESADLRGRALENFDRFSAARSGEQRTEE